MKKLILTSIMLLLVFAVVPAMAGDKSDNSLEPVAFQALSNLTAPGQVALNTMTDEELATVEGARRVQFNISRIRQTNFCLALCLQSNVAIVTQVND